MSQLQAKLDSFKQEFESKVPAAALEAMRRATDELKHSGILDKTIQVGEELPDFSLSNQDGNIIRSQDLLQKKPLVISFFRGVWCPYCNLELAALGEAYKDVLKLGAEMVVISPQTSAFAKKSKKDSKLEFDVLVDSGNKYASTLGTAFTLPSYLKELYSGFRVDMPKHNGDDSWRLPMPMRAVIDQQGLVRYLDINPDYTQRPEISDTLNALRALNT